MVPLETFLIFSIFLIWGSFLNVVAYRLIKGQSIIFPGSRCIHCHQPIAWFDNIPLFSWFFLFGKCRHCHQRISILYPFIELCTALSLTLLWYVVPISYFISYFIFFSALIISIRSDLETMLISRVVTINLIPIALFLSAFGLLPIRPVESMLGSLFGYFILFFTARAFKYLTGKEGIGQGDLDLLACIGAFIGPMGSWFTLFAGSLSGSMVGLLYLFMTQQDRTVKIPFGPFLALGAIGYVLFYQNIIYLLAIL